MNSQLSLSACAIVFAVLMPGAAAAQGPRIQLDQLNRFADKAEEVVDVTVDAAMLQQTVGFLAGKTPDDARLRELIGGITGIFMKSFEFREPNAYSSVDIDGIRKQVAVPGWSRVVGVRGKNEMTEIYFWKEGGVNGGLVVIAAEARELTVVNIVGRVDLASLAALGPMIPKLPKGASKLQ